MLKTAKAFLQSYALVQREMILEMVREQFYKELPSRSKAIYLCKKEQLEYWKNTIAVNQKFCEVFKVNASSTIFKSNDSLLPDNSMSTMNTFIQAQKYWDADFNNIEEKETEYLFVGKIKVLEKV